MIRCVEPDCQRAPVPPTSGGTIFARCEAHTCASLRNAFAHESWADRARADRLPPLVIGGLALDPTRPAPGLASPHETGRRVPGELVRT